MADRHDVELGAGGAGIGGRLVANRGTQVLNERVKARRGRLVDARQADLDRLKRTAPRPSPPTTWAELRPDRNPSATHRAVRRGRGRQIKAAQGAVDEARRLRNIPLVSRANTHKFIVGTTALGAGGTWLGLRGKADPVRKYDRKDVDRFALGSLAGGALYQESSYHLKGRDRKAEAKVAESPELRAKAKAHQKAYGINAGGKRTRAGDPKWKPYFRNYPTDLPGGKLKRTLSYTHGGKTGVALTAGVAGLTGYGATRLPRRQVSKAAYGYSETRISPLRATEAAVGVSLAGWGGSRLGIVRSALKAGSKAPGNAGIHYRRAEKARAALEHQTGRGAAMLGRHTGVGFKLRPVEGAVAGGALTYNAVPVRRREFTPIQGGY